MDADRKQRSYRFVFTLLVANAVLWAVWALGSDHDAVPWPVWVSLASFAVLGSRAGGVLFPQSGGRERNRNRDCG